MGASAKKIRVLVASPLDVTPSTKDEYKALMPVSEKSKKKEETPEQAIETLYKSELYYVYFADFNMLVIK